MASVMPEHAPRKRLRQRKYLPASLMRAGTSRGLFIHQKYLPASKAEWKPWILAAMGSKNNDMRQIDGVGGATSTTSKVCVVAPSMRPGIDVEYTFIQVAVGKESLDFSGNCGNMASGIGPFAVEEELVIPDPGASHVDVSIYNTNTGKKLIETVELDDEGRYLDEGSFMMPGVKTAGSEVKIAFMEPAGSMTGKLLPTGQPCESLRVSQPRNGVLPFEVEASFVDAANPFVIVDASTMPVGLPTGSDSYLDLVEDIRRAGAVQMGLATDVTSAEMVKGTPKVALVSPGRSFADRKEAADVFVSAMTMQQPHPSLQLTGAVCIASASCIPGTVCHRARTIGRSVTGLLTPEDSGGSDNEKETLQEPNSRLRLDTTSGHSVVLAHASGQIKVEVKLREDMNGSVAVERCSVSRTARKIFDGQVLVNL